MNMVATILFDVRSKTVKRAKDLKESAEMHRTIYRAIRKRDAEAASEAMRDHLMLAQKAQASEESDDAPSEGKTSSDADDNVSRSSWSSADEIEHRAHLSGSRNPGN
jgi:GntR family transcriptional regulator, transcriptional repressor for pyruvate dehydrogenase complex